MEVTGIEGNYRFTCERVLRLLRANRESLLAVLEAFVYDPVISWRLLEGEKLRSPQFLLFLLYRVSFPLTVRFAAFRLDGLN